MKGSQLQISQLSNPQISSKRTLSNHSKPTLQLNNLKSSTNKDISNTNNNNNNKVNNNNIVLQPLSPSKTYQPSKSALYNYHNNQSLNNNNNLNTIDHGQTNISLPIRRRSLVNPTYNNYQSTQKYPSLTKLNNNNNNKLNANNFDQYQVNQINQINKNNLHHNHHNHHNNHNHNFNHIHNQNNINHIQYHNNHNNQQLKQQQSHSCPFCNHNKQKKQSIPSYLYNKIPVCPQHQISYDLIGNNKSCLQHTLICCQCLKIETHSHKTANSNINHQTISILQLNNCFQKILQYSQEQIQQQLLLLNQYIDHLKVIIIKQIDKEHERLQKFIINIPLTQITKDKDKLNILEKIIINDFQSISCKDISSIAKKLFSFQPKRVSPGFSAFQSLLRQRFQEMQIKIQEIIKTDSYSNVTMKDMIQKTQYPYFKQDPPQQISEKQEIQSQQLQQQVQPEKTHKSLPKNSFRIKTEQPINKSVTKFIKKKEPLQNFMNVKKPRKPIQFVGSSILIHREDDQFVDKLFQIRKPNGAKLLYRASDHNFSIKSFHQLCDDNGDTIVLLKTQFKKIIGGFTTVPWKSANNTMHPDTSKQSFLFSVSLKQKMNLVDQQRAIFNSINQGPTFGAGADLSICNNANLKRFSYSNFPYSYQNPRYKQNNQHSTFLFTGQSSGCHFYILDWEVWKIKFMNE